LKLAAMSRSSSAPRSVARSSSAPAADHRAPAPPEEPAEDHQHRHAGGDAEDVAELVPPRDLLLGLSGLRHVQVHERPERGVRGPEPASPLRGRAEIVRARGEEALELGARAIEGPLLGGRGHVPPSFGKPAAKVVLGVEAHDLVVRTVVDEEIELGRLRQRDARHRIAQDAARAVRVGREHDEGERHRNADERERDRRDGRRRLDAERVCAHARILSAKNHARHVPEAAGAGARRTRVAAHLRGTRWKSTRGLRFRPAWHARRTEIEHRDGTNARRAGRSSAHCVWW
jgi:hypothetical protein